MQIATENYFKLFHKKRSKISKIQNIPKNIPPVLVDIKIPASRDFLETFENVDDLYVVLVNNQVSTELQPSFQNSEEVVISF